MTVEGTADADAIVSAVENAGYTASVSDNKICKNVNDNLQNAAEKKIFARFIVSIALLIPLMYLSMGHVMWGWQLPFSMDRYPLAVGVTELILTTLILVINQKLKVWKIYKI